ncbi:MAG: T9SS type A sorting domain-containing protein, partial [Bacteroidota bacterium]|nr:T9SS type A sorting domain-containing protein [Bacteroidota bacterium]
YQVQTAHNLLFTIDVEIYSTSETYFILTNLDPVESYYWKVKAISDTLYNSDFSATWSFSTSEDTATSVREIEPSEINIYPNPSNGKVFINIPDETSNKVSVKVFNVNGQKVLSEKRIKENTIIIDLTKQVAGLYFISVQTNEGVINRKIILEK